MLKALGIRPSCKEWIEAGWRMDREVDFEKAL